MKLISFTITFANLINVGKDCPNWPFHGQLINPEISIFLALCSKFKSRVQLRVTLHENFGGSLSIAIHVITALSNQESINFASTITFETM